MKPYVVLRPQGERSGGRARSGLRGPPQLATHGPEEPLRLLPAPRGLLLAGTAGRALHPAAAREQEEAAAPDADRRGAVQTPPAGQEEEGQCAAAGHAQPRDIGIGGAPERVEGSDCGGIIHLSRSRSGGGRGGRQSNIETKWWSNTRRFPTLHPPVIPNAGGWLESPFFIARNDTSMRTRREAYHLTGRRTASHHVSHQHALLHTVLHRARHGCR